MPSIISLYKIASKTIHLIVHLIVLKLQTIPLFYKHSNYVISPFVCNRNPDPSKRSTFDNLLEILQNSDVKMLDWLDSDLEKMTSPQAKVIGSALEEGYSLYKDLQSSYHGITPDITMQYDCVCTGFYAQWYILSFFSKYKMCFIS